MHSHFFQKENHGNTQQSYMSVSSLTNKKDIIYKILSSDSILVTAGSTEVAAWDLNKKTCIWFHKDLWNCCNGRLYIVRDKVIRQGDKHTFDSPYYSQIHINDLYTGELLTKIYITSESLPINQNTLLVVEDDLVYVTLRRGLIKYWDLDGNFKGQYDTQRKVQTKAEINNLLVSHSHIICVQNKIITAINRDTLKFKELKLRDRINQIACLNDDKLICIAGNIIMVIDVNALSICKKFTSLKERFDNKLIYSLIKNNIVFSINSNRLYILNVDTEVESNFQFHEKSLSSTHICIQDKFLFLISAKSYSETTKGTDYNHLTGRLYEYNYNSMTEWTNYITVFDIEKNQIVKKLDIGSKHGITAHYTNNILFVSILDLSKPELWFHHCMPHHNPVCYYGITSSWA